MLEAKLGAYVLFGGIEPEHDCAAPDAREAVGGAGFVLALTPYLADWVERQAHVVLPIAAFAETGGSYVNAEGRWQSVAAAATPPGEARPGWKVLRVLAEVLGLTGFDQDTATAGTSARTGR